MHRLVGMTIALVLLSLGFGFIQARWPSRRGQRWRRPDLGIDLVYWYFIPLLARPVVTATAALVLLTVAWTAGWHLTAAQLAAGYGPIPHQPRPMIMLEALFLLDFVGYWMHRLFHEPTLWRFHAIHHSSVELDWLSSIRLHPVNELITRMAGAVVLVGAGFPVGTAARGAGVLVIYSLLQHANVAWDFGPLRAVLASPTFHRWHHSKDAAAVNKNLAGFFPVFDILFGTYYMPRDRQPTEFGVADAVPSTLWGQMKFPFVRARTKIQDAAAV